MREIRVRRVTGWLFLLVAFGNAAALASDSLKVSYLVVGPRMNREDSSAAGFVRASGAFAVETVALERIAELPVTDVAWIHIEDSLVVLSLGSRTDGLRALRSWYERGGRLLLTDQAARLPWMMGIEPKRPHTRVDSIRNDWLFDKTGFQGFRGHPLFAGMNGGEFIWDPDEDQLLPFVGYFDGTFPAAGHVIGVEKAYVFVFQQRAAVIEYRHGNGMIMTIGSSVYPGRVNHLENNLRRLLANAFTYLAGRDEDGPRTYWEHHENVPRAFSIRTSPIRTSARDEMRKLPSTRLLLTRSKAGDAFFDVAGRRALFMGTERGGLDEVWVHPIRVLRDLEVGLVQPDSVAWLRNVPASIEVRPESFTRVYTTPGAVVREIVFTSMTSGGGVIHVESTAPVRLIVRFRCDLRWMWPFDANALGDLHYGYDEAAGAFHVGDTTGDFWCAFGGDIMPASHTAGAFKRIDRVNGTLTGVPTDLNEAAAAFEYALEPQNGNALNFVIVGTNIGRDSALADYRALAEHPRAAFDETVRHYDRLLASSAEIISPDREFNALFQWAIVGTDRFMAYTPTVGEGLLAGLGTTAHGWNGTHKNSGRPGYAWYFGRDSEWSGFAIDDYGDLEIVRKQLEFLGRYQDPSGKIFHEISTSGVVHYDAADATPLYPILAAHYVRASGDVAFCRSQWGRLEKAMTFLYSTDTDGDGLIENTNVGHGWVEGGDLFGVHTEFYLAGLWAQALGDMAWLGDLLGYREAAAKYRDDAERVRRILNTDFWNPKRQFFNFGKYRDASYQTEPTATVAVPMYLGLVDNDKVRTILESFAGNGFSPDWGVRILSSSSPMFKPTGYHYGSVWPLFTGWVALAEYEYGHPTQGFTHVMSNMLIKNHWALGFVEEVMHGAVYKPTGVDAHQCWSETNILHPALTGMVGWKPDAPHRTATVKPRFPMDWDSVTVRHLRVGESLVALRMDRSTNATRYRFTLEQGPAVRIRLQPGTVSGMKLLGITVDGRKAAFADSSVRGVLADPVVFDLTGTSDVELRHTGGAAMVPIVPRPEPGDSSQGYRLVSESVEHGTYTAVTEGRAGTFAVYAVRVFDRKAKDIEGAERIDTSRRGLVRLRVSYPVSGERFVRVRFSVRLE